MVVASDLHLGKVQDTVTKGGMPSRLFDTRARMYELIAYAKKQKHSIVLAGDIFDSATPTPVVIDILFDIINKAEASSVCLYIIPGNHDSSMNFTSLKYLGNEIMDRKLEYTKIVQLPEVLVIDNKKTLLLPHVPKSVCGVEDYQEWVTDKISAADSKGLDIVIGHAHLAGATNTSDIETEAGDAIHFNPAKCFKYKLGIFGHIHKYQVLNNGKNVYCGPVCTNSFDEAKIEKGFVVVGKNTQQQHEFHAFETPETEYRHITIDLVNKDSIVYDEKKMTKLAKGKLLKITIYARDMMQVDQVDIRKHFDAYGTVVRFEVIISDKYNGEVEVVESDDIFESINYNEVFKKWINDKEEISQDQKKLIIKTGTSVIQEVLDAVRIGSD